MNLIILTFGNNLENYHQSIFSIMSFLKDNNIKRVIVITEKPEIYKIFQDYIHIISINNKIIKEWKGEADYLFRIKIKALEKVQKDYPDNHILFVDTDTFLYSSLDRMYSKLENNECILHKKEYILSQNKKSKSAKKMYLSIKNKIFSGVLVNDKTAMWNSGVIALPKNHAKEIIQLSLNICDEICKTDCPQRVVEQLAFGIAAENLLKVNQCEDIIGHYWSNKNEWNKVIKEFLTNAFIHQYSIQNCIKELSTFNWKSIPVEKKERSTNKRLKGFINKLFPDKDIKYISPS